MLAALRGALHETSDVSFFRSVPGPRRYARLGFQKTQEVGLNQGRKPVRLLPAFSFLGAELLRRTSIRPFQRMQTRWTRNIRAAWPLAASQYRRTANVLCARQPCRCGDRDPYVAIYAQP